MFPPPPNETELLVKEEESENQTKNIVVVKATIESSEEDSDDQQQENTPAVPVNSVSDNQILIIPQALEDSQTSEVSGRDDVLNSEYEPHTIESDSSQVMLDENEDKVEQPKLEADVKDIEPLESNFGSDSIPEHIAEPVANVPNEETDKTPENKSSEDTNSIKSMSYDVNSVTVSEDTMQNQRKASDSIEGSMGNSVDSIPVSNGSVKDNEIEKTMDNVSDTLDKSNGQEGSTTMNTEISKHDIDTIGLQLNDEQDLPNDVIVNPPMPAPRTVSPVSEVSHILCGRCFFGTSGTNMYITPILLIIVFTSIRIGVGS